MPIHVNKVKDKPSRVVVPYGDEKANVDYNQNALSTREWREIRRRAQGEGETADDEFSVAVLSRILKLWDVIGEDKKMYPLTPEALDDLPPQFLNAVVKAVVEDLFPNQSEPAPSSAGSF